jgi:hypothetical protein
LTVRRSLQVYPNKQTFSGTGRRARVSLVGADHLDRRGEQSIAQTIGHCVPALAEAEGWSYYPGSAWWNQMLSGGYAFCASTGRKRRMVYLIFAMTLYLLPPRLDTKTSSLRSATEASFYRAYDGRTRVVMIVRQS